VKVTPQGRKVFLMLYRLAGAGSRLRKYTIDPYGKITLPMARAQAQRIFAARLDARDPADVRTFKTAAKKKTRAANIARTLKRPDGATRQKVFSLGAIDDSRA
jgi:Arm domain-containing DNA-binding protein